MVTRYFDPPVRVLYRSHLGWRSVLALGVRHCDGTYAVLVTRPFRGARNATWVPRSRVRPEDPTHGT